MGFSVALHSCWRDFHLGLGGYCVDRRVGRWMDGWSRGCLTTIVVVFIFTASLTNSISPPPRPAPSPARKGLEGEGTAKEKVENVE